MGFVLIVSGTMIGPGDSGFIGFGGNTIESESWKLISAEMSEST